MGWHLEWVDVSTSLVSVWHWPLTGVDCQNILNIYITQLKSSWKFHFAMTLCHVKSIAWLFWWTFFWMDEKGYWWMKYYMHFQLYFNFNYHYLYPTHILPTHIPYYHYSHLMYMLSTYYCNLYLHITYLPT
jgi:hypothetical protein